MRFIQGSPTAVFLVAITTLVLAPFPTSATDRFELDLVEKNIAPANARVAPLPASGLFSPSAQTTEPGSDAAIENVIAHDDGRRRLVGGMTTTSWILTGLFAVGGTAVLARGSNDEAERVGDVLQLFLPASAYAMTWIGHDGRGAAQYSLQLGTGLALTYGLKQVVSKRTPTADDFDSFPSAHTQAAFSGASFIHRRYGPRWGVPAYVLASYTGLSRVKAERHYLDDVIAGMSIALVSGWTFTHPIEDRVSLNPMLVNGGFGVGITISEGTTRRAASPTAIPDRLWWSYTWEVGRVTVGHNLVQSPGDAGDQVDFRFRERNNPAATSNLQIDRLLGLHHQVSARLAPFEVREEEQFRQPVTFGGVTFERTEVLDTRYVGYDLRLRWRYRAFPHRWLQLHAGAGLETLATRAEITVQPAHDGESTKTGRGSDLHLLPILHLHLGLAPGRFVLYGEVDGTEVGSESYLDWTVGASFSFDRNWRIGLAHRSVEWDLASSEIRNGFESETFNLTVAYHW